MSARPSRAPLLMLAPVMPSDHGNGLAMRAGFFLDAYARNFDVDLVIAPLAGHSEPSPFARARARRIEVLALAVPETHYALAMAVRDPAARVDVFRRYGRPSLTAFVAPLRDALDGLSAENHYRVVHVFRLYMAELATPWLRQTADRPTVVIDCDENDASTYRRIAGMERRRHDFNAAAQADAEADAFDRFAALWLPKFDLALAASRREAGTLATFGVRTAVIPNVVLRAPAAVATRRSRRGAPTSILFVGTLGYGPNADAVTWFVARVWPRLQRALRHRVRLVIVGGGAPPALARLAARRGITIAGAVPDVARAYRDADFVIAPLRAGGGTRIKVIEAAAHGRPVVASRLAIEGTTFQPGVDMLVADDESNMLRLCVELARRGTLRVRLAARARTKMKRDYSPAVWRQRLTELVT